MLNHVFLDCDFFGEVVWSFILKWLGISSVLSSDIGLQASQLGGVHLFRNIFASFFLNLQILLNVIPAKRKVWTKQDTNGVTYRRYTITT